MAKHIQRIENIQEMAVRSMLHDKNSTEFTVRSIWYWYNTPLRHAHSQKK